MFKIFNVRAGFANNSSSTHSIIFLKDHEELPKEKLEDGEFGWGHFTISSETGILKYLNSTLRTNLVQENLNQFYIDAISNVWTQEISNAEGYVDHQSCIHFPKMFNRKGIDKRYFDDIKNLLLSNRTIILGGNDNDEECHPLIEMGDQLHLSNIEKDFICKWDNNEHYWTLFNERTGLKLRLVIDATGERKVMPERASTPDLVDIKITNYCNFGCQYCYQGSTKQGLHADLNDIKHIIYKLSKEEVFEIAYGGGEPTQHPDFIEILKYTRECNIIPNFTTRNIGWLIKNWDEIKDVIGSCAISVDDISVVNRVDAFMSCMHVRHDKIAVQYVLGSCSEYNMQSIIKACSENHINLTLLGFKTVGRGDKYRQLDNSKWLDVIEDCRKNNKYTNIGIDTACVQQYEQMLKERGFPEWLYHKEEGTFSWYIDCVDNKVGKSSYDELTPYTNIYKAFNESWSSILA